MTTAYEDGKTEGTQKKEKLLKYFKENETQAITKASNVMGGLEELAKAKDNIEGLKKELGKYFNDTQSFVESVQATLQDKHRTKWDRIMYACKLKKDDTVQSLSTMMSNLIAGYENYNDQLWTEIEGRQEEEGDLKGLQREMLNIKKETADDIAKYEKDVPKLKTELGDIAGKIEAAQGSARVTLEEKEMDLEEKYTLASRKLGNFNTRFKIVDNIYQANREYVKELRNMIEDAITMKERNDVVIESIRPMFDRIVGGVKMVEVQEKNLQTYRVFQDATNATVLSVAELSMALGKASEELMAQGDLFKPDTIDRLKEIRQEHKQRIEDEKIRNYLEVKDMLNTSGLKEPEKKTTKKTTKKK